MCDACTPSQVEDDTAVMMISFGRRSGWSFDAENAQAADDARHEFLDRIVSLGWKGDALNAAELIFGELIANVVRHAPGPVEIYLDLTNKATPVLHCIDRGSGVLRKPSLPDDPLSENGRGLFIIDQLSHGLEVEHVDGWGNHVAVTLSAQP
jgi:anti-sigma regulatory factor (Ser/Thr protein kinase)